MEAVETACFEVRFKNVVGVCLESQEYRGDMGVEINDDGKTDAQNEIKSDSYTCG